MTKRFCWAAAALVVVSASADASGQRTTEWGLAGDGYLAAATGDYVGLLVTCYPNTGLRLGVMFSDGSRFESGLVVAAVDGEIFELELELVPPAGFENGGRLLDGPITDDNRRSFLAALRRGSELILSVQRRFATEPTADILTLRGSNRAIGGLPCFE